MEEVNTLITNPITLFAHQLYHEVRTRPMELMKETFNIFHSLQSQLVEQCIILQLETSPVFIQKQMV